MQNKYMYKHSHKQHLQALPCLSGDELPHKARNKRLYNPSQEQRISHHWLQWLLIPETTITLSSICIEKQSLQCCCSPNFGKQTGRIPQTLHHPAHLQAGASSLLFLLKFCSFSLLPTENKGSREAKEKGEKRKFTLAPMEGKGRKEKIILLCCWCSLCTDTCERGTGGLLGVKTEESGFHPKTPALCSPGQAQGVQQDF